MVAIANGWASIVGYMPGSLPDISLLCARRVSFYAILVCESAPSWATKGPKACVWPTQSTNTCHQPSPMVPIANGWASIVGYMPGSLPDISLLCARRVSFYAILVCESAPSWATKGPKACVWPTQSTNTCHQPSPMVPIANGWASIVGYMPGSLPDISLLCARRVSFYAILVCESAPSWATKGPKACVWPTHTTNTCQQPSPMCPIANGWASIVGYMPGSLPDISLLCTRRVSNFVILVRESAPSQDTRVPKARV